MEMRRNQVLVSITRALTRIVFTLLYRLRIQGMENIPGSGKLILCSNHTTWMDPFFYWGYVPRPVYFMGKESAFKNPLIRYYLKSLGSFPVARGQRDQAAMDTAYAILEKGDVLGMFPEGTRVKNGLRVRARKGVAVIAVTADAPVIPVLFSGSFKLFTQVTCTFGRPYRIDKTTLEPIDSDMYQQISNEILDRVYSLQSG
jgi:1-acyl-sn-glycerol-3-phosphate acyltransferase